MRHDRPIHPPILLYHNISGLRRPGERSPSGRAVFEHQMRYLASKGYRALNPQQLLDILDNPSHVPPKTVYLSFDDGWRDFYEDVFPVLAELGLTATVFVVTAMIDGGIEAWTGKRPERESAPLTWREIEEMSGAGISFGSHTHTHPMMSTLSPQQLEEEVRVSKQLLEDRIGMTVRLFAYPYGDFSDAAKEAVRQADYSAAFAWTSRGLDRFELRRRSIPPARHILAFQMRTWRVYPLLLRMARLNPAHR